jgi:hypothetical protein
MIEDRKNKSLKKISRTSRPILINLGTNHNCMKGIPIQVSSNKEPGLLQQGDNRKMQK